MPRTIMIKGRGIRKEINAGGVVRPGHLLKINADGTGGVHTTAAGVAARTFVFENELFGKGVTDAYAVGDRILYEHVHSGQEVYARLAPGAAAVALGAFLESDGTGCLRATVATSAGTIAQALEAVNNSAGGSEAFILVQIL